MKKTLRIVSLIVLLAATVLAVGDNPYAIMCDYHGVYFYKGAQEFPMGKCYDTYSHVYWDYKSQRNLTHRMVMPCAK